MGAFTKEYKTRTGENLFRSFLSVLAGGDVPVVAMLLR